MSQYAGLAPRPYPHAHNHKHGHHHDPHKPIQPSQPTDVPCVTTAAQPAKGSDQPNGTHPAPENTGFDPDAGVTDKPTGGVDAPVSYGGVNCGTTSIGAAMPTDDIDRRGYYLVTADGQCPRGYKYAVVYYKDTRYAQGRVPSDGDFALHTPKKAPCVWEEVLHRAPFISQDFLWAIATAPLVGRFEIGTKCGVGVDDKRGYMIYKDDDTVLFKGILDNQAVAYRKNYYIVDERNQPITYGKGPHHLCVAAVGTTQTRYGIAYFEDGKNINGKRKPDDFTWVDGSPSADEKDTDLSDPREWWDGKLSTASFQPSFKGDEDFQCCIASIARNGPPKAWVGTAKRRDQGLLIYKDDATNCLFTEEGLGCYSYYYCTPWKGGL